MKKIPYGRQTIDEGDIRSVIETLSSDYITQGPIVEEFENKVSRYCNSEFSIAFNSATSALHAACYALNLKKGDWLWTSPISFVSSANCGIFCGAKVDFVDIDIDTYNLCPIKLEEKLISAKKNNTLPKIVIPVHMAGQSCDMKKIHELSRQYGFKVIEDASHAIGGEYKDNKIGNCKYSDITVFSFHPVKIITTGEGGIALTNNESLNRKLKLHRSHGIVRSETNNDEGWLYEQIELGYNYRMNDIEASLGISQLKKLDRFVQIRNQLAERYNKLINSKMVTKPQISEDCLSSFHLYIVRINKNVDRKAVFNFLRNAGIEVNVHYIPIHTQPYYKNTGVKFANLTNAESYYESAITLPIFPSLTQSDQDYVVDTLMESIDL